MIYSCTSDNSKISSVELSNMDYHQVFAKSTENINQGFATTNNLKQLLTEKFPNIILDNNNVYMEVVMYSDQNINYENPFENEYGFLLITHSSANSVIQQLYDVNTGQLVTQHKYEATSTIDPVLYVFLAKDVSENISSYLYISDQNNTVLNYSLNNINHYDLPKENFGTILNQTLFAKYAHQDVGFYDSVGGGTPCGMMCSGPSDLNCKISAPGGLDCRKSIDEMVCETIKSNEIVSVNSYQEDDFDLVYMRDFRDNFLKKSSKGLRYIEIYYELNDYLRNIDFLFKTDFKQNIEALGIGIKVSERIQNGNNNTVLLESTDATFLKNYLL